MNDLRTVFHLPINDAAKKVRARLYKKSVLSTEAGVFFFGHALPATFDTSQMTLRVQKGGKAKKEGPLSFFFFSCVCLSFIHVPLPLPFLTQKTNQKNNFFDILVGIVRDCSQTEMPRVWHRALAVSQGEED
jgi:hypothetical protein